MTTATPAAGLIQARRTDVERRRRRVHQALTTMAGDGCDISVSATATRAGVHRSFIHRHPDLHAAVLKAAADAITSLAPSTTISHRSALAENANLREQNRRLAQHASDLENRLSELLGRHAFERSGLGAPTDTAALHAELETQRQTNLELRRVIEERDEELGAARETIRRLMTQLNHNP